MANKNQRLSKKRRRQRNPTPFSKLDVYKELEEIKIRVSNVKYSSMFICQLRHLCLHIYISEFLSVCFIVIVYINCHAYVLYRYWKAMKSLDQFYHIQMQMKKWLA